MSTERFALQAWSKAEVHFAEAAAQQPAVTPGAIVHLAYYAMFHAARAALLRQGGPAPKKHASVVGQFGLFVKDQGLESRRAGENIRDIQDRRIRADYKEEARMSAEDAQDPLRKARAFLDLCSKEFGFPRAALTPDA